MKNSSFFVMMLVTLTTQQLLFRRVAAAFSISPTARKSLVRYSAASDSHESLDSSRENGISSSVDDRFAEYRNKNNVRDQVFSAISKDGSIKVTTATVRNIVNDIMVMQTMTEVPADAIGRLVTCSLLISNGMQAEQTFQITMSGDGPLRGAMAIATGSGEVRGYAGSPGIGGGLTLQEAIGKGSVQVVKNHPDWPNPYNGITAIRNGDIDRDIGIYLAESEQRSCALAAATSINGLLCKAAGGYLVEKLPGCDEETAKEVEKNLAKLVEMDGGERLPTNLLLKGVTPVEIAQIILEGLDMQPLQQIEPKYVCECSEERLFRALRLLPREEVEEILAKEEQIEARCHFCGKEYRMSPQEVEKRFATARGDPSKE